NITPASGYFGPLTRASVNANCRGTSVKSTNTKTTSSQKETKNTEVSKSTKSTKTSSVSSEYHNELDYVVGIPYPNKDNVLEAGKNARLYGNFYQDLTDIFVYFKGGSDRANVPASLDFANAVQFEVPDIKAGTY